MKIYQLKESRVLSNPEFKYQKIVRVTTSAVLELLGVCKVSPEVWEKWCAPTLLWDKYSFIFL